LRKGVFFSGDCGKRRKHPGRASGKKTSVSSGYRVFHSLDGLKGGDIMRLCDIVISETRWRSLEGLRQPILADKSFSCAFRMWSGERSSRRYGETMLSLAVARRFPSGSVTSWSPTPASCSRSRSRARLCVPRPEALRTGSVGASPMPYDGPPLAGGSPEVRVGIVRALSESDSPSTEGFVSRTERHRTDVARARGARLENPRKFLRDSS